MKHMIQAIMMRLPMGQFVGLSGSEGLSHSRDGNVTDNESSSLMESLSSSTDSGWSRGTDWAVILGSM